MSTLKKAAPFLILGGVAAMVGGGVLAYNSAEAKQKLAREQAFTDLSQCLLGEIVASGDDTINSINMIQNRVAHRPDATRGNEDGKPWPQRCGGYARDMGDAVRTSSFLDESAKRDLLKETDLLTKDLESVGATGSYLAHPVLGVWRAAEKHGLAMTQSSNAIGPPKPAVFDSASQGTDVPFSSVLPIRNGPSWHFLAVRKDKPGALSSCTPTAQGLSCVDFTFDGALNPIGTWSNPSFIPLWDGRQLQRLNDGKIEPLDTKIVGAEPRVHVDEKGTLYLIGTSFVDDEVKLRLTVVPLGGKPKSVTLEKALDKASEGAAADAVTATLLGPNVVIRRTGADGVSGELQMFAITEGAKLAEPTKIPSTGSVDLIPNICRVGNAFALNLSPQGTSLVFYEGGKWSAPAKSDKHGFDCTPAGGVWIGDGDYCRAGSCSEVFSKEDSEAFIGSLGGLPRSDLVGDKVVSVWGAKEGSGLLLRIATLGDKSAAVELLVSEKSDPKRWNLAGVYGDATGATVLAEVEQRVIGARVTADGKVLPLKITTK